MLIMLQIELYYISNASVASGYKMLGNVPDPPYRCISTSQTPATGARALVPPSGRVVNIIYQSVFDKLLSNQFYIYLKFERSNVL